MKQYMRFVVPLGLAVAAALANYAVLKRHSTKVDVLVLTEDVAEGDAITADRLATIKVQGDEKLFPSALRPENLGEFTNLAVRRNIRAGEVLLRADLERRLLPLYSGEHSWTVRVSVNAADLDLVPGDRVQLFVSPGDGNKPRVFGPYRLRGWDAAEGTGKERTRAYLVAVPNGDAGELQAQAWIDHHRDGGNAVRSIARTTEAPNTKPNVR